MTLADIRLGLREFLLDDGAIAAVVTDRVFPIVLKQGEQRASIVYQRISGQGDHTLQQPTWLARPRYQIDCWSLVSGEANSLANLVKERIDGFRGEMPYGLNSPQAFVTVLGVFFTDEREDFDPPTKLYRVSRDYFIWHREL